MILPRIYAFLALSGVCLLVALGAQAPPAAGGTLVLDRIWKGTLSAGAEAHWKTASGVDDPAYQVILRWVRSPAP
jgi:hypothetical protein